MWDIKFKKRYYEKNSDWVNWLEPLIYVKENLKKSELEKLTFDNIKIENTREENLIKYRNQLKFHRNNIKSQFFKTSDGTMSVGLNSIIVDNLLKVLIKIKNFSFSEKINFTIVALGGYGRGELAPHSDIDIIFLLNDKMPLEEQKKTENHIENILYYLWDLNFKIGHSTRTIKEVFENCPSDLNLLTSLLDNRYVVGEKKIFLNFQNKFEVYLKKSNALNFVKKKLEESEKRHLKFGGSRYVVEPNVKEGKGGIRDLQTFFTKKKIST